MSEKTAIVLGAPSAAPAVAPGAAAPPGKPRPPEQTFGAVLRALGEETRRGERLVDRASSGVGRDVTAGELLALQAGVYRYVETIDLASKLVDRVTQGAKSLVQGGGQ